jgi:hypothetical protein
MNEASDAHRAQERIAPELKAELERYAIRRAAMVRRAGIPVPASYASELIDDVWADTLTGLSPWDPRRELLEHLKNAIRKRTWLEIRRAHRFPLVPLHEPTEAEFPAQEPDSRRVILAAVTAAVCRELWPLVSCDIDARAIMTSWLNGSVEKAEVMQFTRLSNSAYMSARRRLRLMLRGVTPEVRQAALDLLRT